MNKERTVEFWDIYTKERQRTGRTHQRGLPLNEGDYHMVVHVCIFNSKNQMLIQQRVSTKKDWPDMWDVSVGGSALAGETSSMAAERETMEELGLSINLSDTRPAFTINFPEGFDDYYLIKKEVELSELTLQKEEVQDVRWADKEEVIQMLEEGTIIPHRLLLQLFDRRAFYL